MGCGGARVQASRVKDPEKGNLGSDQRNEVSETDRAVRGPRQSAQAGSL